MNMTVESKKTRQIQGATAISNDFPRHPLPPGDADKDPSAVSLFGGGPWGS